MAFVPNSLLAAGSSGAFARKGNCCGRPRGRAESPWALHVRSGSIVASMCADNGSSADVNYDTLGREMEERMDEPGEVIDRALADFGDDVAIAFSGAEDVALIEHASRTGRPFRVFALDTGRLHPETYRFFYNVEKHYKIRIEYVFPDKEDVEQLVNEKGLFSFYEDGHQGSDGKQLIKFNPLANVTSAEIWALIRMVEVPFNPLHEKGMVSIGCEPCTRPVLPNQHEREGRWWWEEATQKECGLHKGNIAGSTSTTRKEAERLVYDAVRSAPVVLFTKSTCPYCRQAKYLLRSLQVEFREIVVDELEISGDVIKVLDEETSRRTVPNIFVNQRSIGGNQEIQELHNQGKLVPILSKAGVSVHAEV